MNTIKIFRPVTLLLPAFLFLLACKKAPVAEEALNITPEQIAEVAGKDWNAVKSNFNRKKGYWYSELNNPTTKAAITVPAIDLNSPVPELNYKLIINVGLDNKVSVIRLESTDTLGMAKGNKLMLYHYERVFRKFNQPTTRLVTDMESNGAVLPITVSELLARLHAGSSLQPSFAFGNGQVLFSAVYFSAAKSFAFEGR